MPAPLDISIWHSIWAIEKKKNQKVTIKESLFDFNVGYFATVILGICFVSLGALVMYNSGISFSNSGSVFANQLIELYTSNLGDSFYLIIAFKWNLLLVHTESCAANGLNLLESRRNDESCVLEKRKLFLVRNLLNSFQRELLELYRTFVQNSRKMRNFIRSILWSNFDKFWRFSHEFIANISK